MTPEIPITVKYGDFNNWDAAFDVKVASVPHIDDAVLIGGTEYFVNEIVHEPAESRITIVIRPN